MNWTFTQMQLIVVIGLVGGTLGGLLGLGGSVFIIPALTLLFGTNQHLYQAGALVANVFVATAATLRHRHRGTIRKDIVPTMAAAAAVSAVCGVWLSNQIAPKPLAAVFGLFLCYASIAEFIGIVRRREDPEPPPVAGRRTALGVSVGLVGGFASGLLGIGGGALMVPLLRRFGKLSIRQAVASSAAAMIVACSIGAIAKNVSVNDLLDADGTPLSIASSIYLAALLSPSAMLGGAIGASLVYRLPVVAIRAVLSMLLAFAGVRMTLTGGGELWIQVRALVGFE